MFLVVSLQAPHIQSKLAFTEIPLSRYKLSEKKFKIMAQHRKIFDTVKFKAVIFVSMSSTEKVIDATIFSSCFTRSVTN